jgi:hypothetical protein
MHTTILLSKRMLHNTEACTQRGTSGQLTALKQPSAVQLTIAIAATGTKPWQHQIGHRPFYSRAEGWSPKKSGSE